VPSIIPGFVYSLFAALVVGVILVSACSVATSTIRADAEKQQLRNIDEYVAAQSLALLSHGGAGEQNLTQFLDVPYQVGNQRFWITITNGSSAALVQSGFGVDVLSSQIQVEIPSKVAASGSFVSGSGRPVLQCHFENGIASLMLTQE